MLHEKEFAVVGWIFYDHGEVVSRHGNQRIKWKGFKRLETGEESSGVGSGLCCGVLKGGAAPLEHRGGSCTKRRCDGLGITTVSIYLSIYY